MGVYSVHLVGESRYQDAIRALGEGEPVSIEHEPDNPFDALALRVSTATGEPIGYIPRDSWVRRVFHDEGTEMSARVEAVIGGERGKPSRGVIIEVRTAVDAEDRAAAPPAPRVRRLRWWHWVLMIVLGLIVLGAIVGEPEQPPRHVAAFTGAATSIGGPGTYTVTIAPDALPGEIGDAARSQCAGKRQCTVMGWIEGTAAPRAFPMLDREVATMAYSYTLNRDTNFERDLWDCTRWPHDADQCLPKEPVE